MSAAAVVAAICAGVASACLLGGRRTSALRDLAPPPDDDAVSGAIRIGGHLPSDLVKSVSRADLRVGLLAGVVVWLGLGQGIIGAAAGVAAMPLAVLLLRWAQAEPGRRRRKSLVAQLPGCLDLLAAGLDAGVPLRAAVAHVAELADDPSAGLLRGVLAHLEIGRSDAQAWSTLKGDPVWGGAARDLARCADSGSAVAEVLSVHAAEARAQRRAQREAAARTTGVRSVLPLVCCFLPAFVLVGVVPIVAATLGSLTLGR